jgi:phasin family protein
MTTMFEDAGAFGKEWMQSSTKSFASLNSMAQGIASEMADYTKSSYEAGAAAFEKLFSAKSLEAAIEIQTDYSRKAYEGLVAETTKLSGLYADMAKEAYKPFEQMVAKAR